METKDCTITDCIAINDEHRGQAAALLAAIAAELRASGHPLPPSLAAWESHMQRIAEWQSRRPGADVRGEGGLNKEIKERHD